MLENLIVRIWKSPKPSSAYTEKLNEYLARHVDDNDDIKEAWTLLKNVFMHPASTILERIERAKHKDWFDAECEEATTSKNSAYKRMQQRNLTRKAVEEYRTARSEGKTQAKEDIY